MASTARTLLERLPAGKRLTRQQRRALLEILEVQRLAAGESLYEQGEEPTQMGLLLAGELMVSARSADGSTLPLGRVGPGEVVGEMGLLDGLPRSASVTSQQASVLLVLDLRRYRELELRSDPLLTWMLELAARSMAQRIGRMTERIAAAATDPSQVHELPHAARQRPQRLWAWLLGLERQA
jgi:CRP/FNR family cyclic AMP-dependent transcriptional regulator